MQAQNVSCSTNANLSLLAVVPHSGQSGIDVCFHSSISLDLLLVSAAVSCVADADQYLTCDLSACVSCTLCWIYATAFCMLLRQLVVWNRPAQLIHLLWISERWPGAQPQLLSCPACTFKKRFCKGYVELVLWEPYYQKFQWSLTNRPGGRVRAKFVFKWRLTLLSCLFQQARKTEWVSKS